MPKPSDAETLLDAGLRVFHQRGFEASGVQDIVSAAGVMAMHEPFRQVLLSKWQAWAALLARCVKDGQQDGSIRTDVSAVELARTLLALWQGAVLMARVKHGATPLNTARKNIRRLLHV